MKHCHEKASIGQISPKSSRLVQTFSNGAPATPCNQNFINKSNPHTRVRTMSTRNLKNHLPPLPHAPIPHPPMPWCGFDLISCMWIRTILKKFVVIWIGTLRPESSGPSFMGIASSRWTLNVKAAAHRRVEVKSF